MCKRHFQCHHSWILLKFSTVQRERCKCFIQNLALFFYACLEKHLSYFEANGIRDEIISAHFYLVKISLVDDKEIFKVCLEYWNKLVCDLFKEFPFAAGGGGGNAQMTESALLLGPLVQTNSRRAMYAEVMSQLRHVMINRRLNLKKY